MEPKEICPVCFDDKTLILVPCKTYKSCCKECWLKICKNNQDNFIDYCPMCAKCVYRIQPITYFT